MKTTENLLILYSAYKALSKTNLSNAARKCLNKQEICAKVINFRFQLRKRMTGIYSVLFLHTNIYLELMVFTLCTSMFVQYNSSFF